MNSRIYYGELRKCIYAGMAGNMFGVPHYEIVEEGVYFAKVGESRYVRIEDLITGVKKPKILRIYATEVGEYYVGSLISLDEIVKRYRDEKGEVDSSLIEIQNNNRLIEQKDNNIEIDKIKTLG